MTVLEYIKRKNAIFHTKTGITLVEDKYLKDVPAVELGFRDDGRMCPYCRVYPVSCDCAGCPMAVDNHCEEEGSSYMRICHALSTIPGRPANLSEDDDLIALVEEFNKQFKGNS